MHCIITKRKLDLQNYQYLFDDFPKLEVDTIKHLEKRVQKPEWTGEMVKNDQFLTSVRTNKIVGNLAPTTPTHKYVFASKYNYGNFLALKVTTHKCVCFNTNALAGISTSMCVRACAGKQV